MTCLGDKHFKVSLKGVRARFTKMAERMDIEDFFEEIDPDLLKYASVFRKCGFSSCVNLQHFRSRSLAYFITFILDRRSF